jgi:hypothetical protein
VGGVVGLANYQMGESDSNEHCFWEWESGNGWEVRDKGEIGGGGGMGVGNGGMDGEVKRMGYPGFWV